MTLAGLWLMLLVGYGLGRYAEYRIHKKNYDFLMYAGAEELIPRVMRRFYNAIFWFIPIGFGEAYWFRTPVTYEILLLGVSLVAVATLLRLWAINSMGRLWTMRCVFLPGAPVSRKGPFRLMRHPEYVSRVFEGVGLLVVIGSYGSAVAYACYCGYLAVSIANIEHRQLTELKGEIGEEEPAY